MGTYFTQDTYTSRFLSTDSESRFLGPDSWVQIPGSRFLGPYSESRFLSPDFWVHILSPDSSVQILSPDYWVQPAVKGYIIFLIVATP